MYHFLENTVTTISHLDVHIVWQTKDLEIKENKTNKKNKKEGKQFKRVTEKQNNKGIQNLNFLK